MCRRITELVATLSNSNSSDERSMVEWLNAAAGSVRKSKLEVLLEKAERKARRFQAELLLAVCDGEPGTPV